MEIINIFNTYNNQQQLNLNSSTFTYFEIYIEQKKGEKSNK